ncbi:uncharacterized protein A1O9_12163 [Exophiala aquamarina CBS 119918]|uniref:Uncharacterized protein n=1 Tax=Exophiala aquamarina CBS 119918 TaxID=1182545 RepID=A0A072NW69_9EURO|nr:uncharacterized protein A1O9_12163 [Exophiala aquamarina CBS 119918]KEF51826.1 hypothetical protein A1O9_12163 [Exophiala aquamarina CBS 119918]
MFRNPMVVNGFPILARHENEQGLEISLGIMSILAEAHFATHYNTTLVLKGLCTMLVPTRRTDRSITWHFLLNENGMRIPYFSFRERCPEDGDIRHFVGWVSDITRHLEEVKYDEINWAGAKKCSPGLAIEQKLTISISKIVGGSVNAVRGSRETPEFSKHSGYSVQIKKARNIYVVLYDVGAQRGWLVDGAKRFATSRANTGRSRTFTGAQGHFSTTRVSIARDLITPQSMVAPT